MTMADDRHICTKDDPWTPAKSSRATHPDAEPIKEHYGGIGDNYERFECPNCGLRFTVELSDG